MVAECVKFLINLHVSSQFVSLEVYVILFVVAVWTERKLLLFIYYFTHKKSVAATFAVAGINIIIWLISIKKDFSIGIVFPLD